MSTSKSQLPRSIANATGIDHNTVSVISGHTNTVTATIRVGRYPQGVAADPKTNTIYTANTFDNTVSVISGRTNTVIATIRVAARGVSPADVAVDPKTDTVYVADFAGNTFSVINGQTNTVTANISLASPVGIALDPKTKTVYVTNSTYPSGSVSVLGPCPK